MKGRTARKLALQAMAICSYTEIEAAKSQLKSRMIPGSYNLVNGRDIAVSPRPKGCHLVHQMYTSAKSLQETTAPGSTVIYCMHVPHPRRCHNSTFTKIIAGE